MKGEAQRASPSSWGAGADQKNIVRLIYHGWANHTISGKVDLQYSLCSLLGEYKDFKEEETALQFLGTQLGSPFS
jgi:hypothetical protein